MATILARKQANGSTRYTAVIRIRKGKTLIHQEAKTFSLRGATEKWAKSREVALEDPSALMRAQHGDTSLSQLIRWYIDGFQAVSKWQRTKRSQLEFLEKHSIGKAD